MASEICIKSFATSSGVTQIGTVLDSGNAIVAARSAFFELVTPASSSIATTSFAYGTTIVNRGDVFATANAVVVAAPAYFVTADGGTAAQKIRAERIGAPH